MNAVFIGVLGMMLFGSGDEIGFVEDFALARDRSTALKQLIPGTEDYYYYTALHQLNTQQFARVKETLTAWIERHGRTERVRRIQFRHALLTYDQNPRETCNSCEMNWESRITISVKILALIPRYQIC